MSLLKLKKGELNKTGRQRSSNLGQFEIAIDPMDQWDHGPHVEWGWGSPEPNVIPRRDTKRSISLDIKFCHLFDLFKERNRGQASRRLFPPSSGIFRVCSLIYSLSEEQQSHLLISLYPRLSFYPYPISLRGSINFRYSFFWSVSLFYYFMRSGFWLESLFMLVSGGFQVVFFFFRRLQFVWLFFFL